ncbi:hypothetical protein P2W68_06865 [Chryseobacterium arthrosphaerae]|uniref:hypothetical protein n=1 Tax=Chryseobacterium arthrosphaerae TaxID=651561 RepID=UPI0023E2B6A3|nr:hypothetical protein [Chryseobacterium arthrosphaerae]WES99331.1 hypothetical protein P2W68_06865 [Chryseobacterium arthrosphaerae]
METQTIISIKKTTDEIKEKLKTADFKNFKDNTYGGENEYSYKGLIGGIDSLLTDISLLTRHHNKFIRISTYDERNSILSQLNDINRYFSTPLNYISSFDSLKKIIRNYNARYFEERVLEFDKEISELIKNKIEFIEIKQEVASIHKETEDTYGEIKEQFSNSEKLIEDLNNEINTLNEKKEKLIIEIEELESKNEKVLEIKEQALANQEEISNSLAEIKSNEKLIQNFASNVQNRDNRLTELEENIEQNKLRIKEYDEERVKILSEASALIKSAKQALNYKTAEGISASFQEQYNHAKNKYILGGWIVGAFLFIIGTLALGIWILQVHKPDDNLGLIISRISLIPILVVGSIFCANQYTKQKNIIEDYAYKMVLSKAIVGFSEQLKKNQTTNDEEYVHYIKTALMEIHKDPLRSRINKESKNIPNTNITEIIEIVEKLKNLTNIN